MNILEEIKNTPIKLDDWMIEQIGVDNGGPYKDAYPKIPVRDSNIPLVSVSDYGIVSSDYYLGEYLSGKEYLESAVKEGLLKSFAYLRQTHIERLKVVDEFLRKHGYFLHVQSGWRHPRIQEIVKKEFARINGEDQANRMFAPVIEGAAPPPHATGAAFDLEVRSLKYGRRQELYYAVNGKQIYGAHDLERIASNSLEVSDDELAKEVIKNRRVLFHCLCTLGVVFTNEDDLFTSHPGECWHFGDGDPLSAYLNKEPFARFGLAVPSDS